MSNLIGSIIKQVEDLFTKSNFNKIVINNELNFENKGNYYKFTFVKGLNGFVVESAESIDEAQKNRYEDDDVYPLSLGAQNIIAQLNDDIKRYYV